MNKRQWVVLIAGLALIGLFLLTLIGPSEYAFMIVNGKPVTLFDSAAVPVGVNWLVLAGLLMLTAVGLFLLRSTEQARGCARAQGEQEGEWPPPPKRPLS